MTRSKAIKLIFAFATILFSVSIDADLKASASDVILADFEKPIPCSDCGDAIGFRKQDVERFVILPDGTEDSKKSASVLLTPKAKSIYFQGKVRRMYLATGSPEYDPNGPNAISFWIKIPEGSDLFGVKDKCRFLVTTYHWRPGDKIVGGKNNTSLATDSKMQGVSYLLIDKKLKDKWINIVLTPSAFRTCYSRYDRLGEGITEDLKFVPSIRQIQFHIDRATNNEQAWQIDQIKLVRLEPTAVFLPDFYKATVSIKTGQIRVPVIIKNPTDKDRKYRVFISSEIGVDNKDIHESLLWEHDICASGEIRLKTKTGDGTGVVELIDKNNNPVIASQAEISIPAGKSWEGTFLHHIKPEMLGKPVFLKFGYLMYKFRRDTLTTSVIVWDPNDPMANQMQDITLNRPGFFREEKKYDLPPGFPEQKELPEGWRAQDIPLNQLGGYFVSILKLTD